MKTKRTILWLLALTMLAATGIALLRQKVLSRPFPASSPLAERADIHPRLYLTSSQLPGLRQACRSTRQSLWHPVKAWTDQHLDQEPPAALKGDFRRAGELIPYAALTYLMTEDPQYRELAVRYLRALCRQPDWGDNVDIEAAHLLYGVAVGYDWLYPKLSTPDRNLIRDKLTLQARKLRVLCGRRHPPLNNHRVITLAALGTAGLALYPDVPRAAEWVRYANRQLEETLRFYGEDGFSCEGPSYWSYTTEYLLKYASLSDELTGSRLMDTPWLKAGPRALQHLMVPSKSWSSNNLVLNLDDSPRFTWYGPHYQLYRLASHFRDSRAQWLADRVQHSRITRHHADWLAVLWHDPQIQPEAPTNELSIHAANLDILLARSDWNGSETFCSFRCSPIGGHHRPDGETSRYPGSGHSHPDANSFTVFGRGAWLAAAPGEAIPKRTVDHNTLTFDGIGQLGEGERWMNGREALRHGSHPHFVEHRTTPTYDYALGDASSAYPQEADITVFERHFLYLRPDIVVLLDTVVPRRPLTTTWRLLTPGRVEILSPATAMVSRDRARLFVTCLLPRHELTFTEGFHPLDSHYADFDWSKLYELAFHHMTEKPTHYLVVMRVQSSDEAKITATADKTANGLKLELHDTAQGDYRVLWRHPRKLDSSLRLEVVEQGALLTERVIGP